MWERYYYPKIRTKVNARAYAFIGPSQNVLMVPMSERRHRIYESEISAVKSGLRLLLEKLLRKRDEPEQAEVAFIVNDLDRGGDIFILPVSSHLDNCGIGYI